MSIEKENVEKSEILKSLILSYENIESKLLSINEEIKKLEVDLKKRL